MAEEIIDVADYKFDMTKKKKKKQKVSFLPTSDQPVEEISDGTETGKSDISKKVQEEEEVIDFKSLQKMKRKSQRQEAASNDNLKFDEITPTSIHLYKYQAMLSQAYKIMKEKNPELMDVSRKVLLVKFPSLARVGTKKTAFTNFHDICLSLKRSPDHFSQYIFAELGTSGSKAQSEQLIMKGRFTQKQIEHIISTYVKGYVSCKACRSLKTELIKKERLHFILCCECQSEFSVPNIKAGTKGTS